MCRSKNRGRRFDKINGKCSFQFAGSKRGIAIYKKSVRKKRRQFLNRDIRTILKETNQGV